MTTAIQNASNQERILDKAVTARGKNGRRKKHRKLRLEKYMPSTKRRNRAQIVKALVKIKF